MSLEFESMRFIPLEPRTILAYCFIMVTAIVPELEQYQPIELESSQLTIVHVHGSNLLQPLTIYLDDNTSLSDGHIDENVSVQHK